jgi:DNA-binding SARP family transcriptional activator/DNA-binding HxlR family transcriptional regulator
VGEALQRDALLFADYPNAPDLEPSTLEARLSDLVTTGLMDRIPAPSGDSAVKYRLTEKGRSLNEVIAALEAWNLRWATSTEPEEPDFEDATSKALIEISLLGAFNLNVGGKAISGLSVGSQRLLVFLALHDRAVTRIAVAGTMWPDATDERAGISLRSALSRLDPLTRETILIASAGLELAETVAVDLRDAQALARRLLHPGEPLLSTDLSSDAIAVLSQELLPDWYDDWVVAEAEDWRQLRMTALEALAQFLIEKGRLAEAASAARAAMKVEPLRESAHASLIRVHLAEGNQSEALRVYERYRELLLSALDLEPTEHVSGLVADIRNTEH